MKKIILILFILLNFVAFAEPYSNLSPTEKDTIETDLKMYPNPVKNDRVTISFQNREISEIRIMNITGKEVRKEMYDFPVQKAVLQINEIPNGIYIVQIKTSENLVVAKKLIVSKD